MTDQAVSRGEFDLLRQIVSATQARVENIDTGGTRGVAVVQTQLIDVVKDLTELKAEVNSRFDAHVRVHAQDQQNRVIGRRWLVGIGVAGLASMSAVITLLLDVLSHVHS